MKEKPILFSTPMVQALLNTKPNTWPAEPIDPGKPFKSQTRRVMKPQPEPEGGGESEFDSQFWSWKDCRWIEGGLGFPESGIGDYAPYKVGDVLWVRETFCDIVTRDMWGEYSVDGYVYKADEIHDVKLYMIFQHKGEKWRPSIFLPREAARIFLKVKSVHIERVQDISNKDCMLEGLDENLMQEICERQLINGKCKLTSMADLTKTKDCIGCDYTKMEWFKRLWDSINAKRSYSWETNPWVWVYEFMRVEK